MFKKFWNENKGYFIFLFIMLAIFMCGFFCGRCRKSTPKNEFAETKITDVEAVSTEQPKETYTEISVVATAYCPCEKCCGKSDGITATGTKARAGRTIAVDPSVIPYGTEVIIDGHTYIAEDCGGCVNGNRIDIFFNTHEEALFFGKRQLKIFVKEGE